MYAHDLGRPVLLFGEVGHHLPLTARERIWWGPELSSVL